MKLSNLDRAWRLVGSVNELEEQISALKRCTKLTVRVDGDGYLVDGLIMGMIDAFQATRDGLVKMKEAHLAAVRRELEAMGVTDDTPGATLTGR